MEVVKARRAGSGRAGAAAAGGEGDGDGAGPSTSAAAGAAAVGAGALRQDKADLRVSELDELFKEPQFGGR